MYRVCLFRPYALHPGHVAAFTEPVEPISPTGHQPQHGLHKLMMVKSQARLASLKSHSSIPRPSPSPPLPAFPPSSRASPRRPASEALSSRAFYAEQCLLRVGSSAYIAVSRFRWYLRARAARQRTRPAGSQDPTSRWNTLPPDRPHCQMHRHRLPSLESRLTGIWPSKAFNSPGCDPPVGPSTRSLRLEKQATHVSFSACHTTAIVAQRDTSKLTSDIVHIFTLCTVRLGKPDIRPDTF